MSALVYEYGENLYVNATNKCPCNCIFCIRKQDGALGTAENLWLDREPTAAEIVQELKRRPLEKYSEVVFCGYGEPFCALWVVLDVCRYLRGFPELKIRINTNGLGDLINDKPTAALLSGLADIISVSLNAPNARRYVEICRPEYGLPAFEAMLSFTRDCKKYLPAVQFTVLDILDPQEMQDCKDLATSLGVGFKVRRFAS